MTQRQILYNCWSNFKSRCENKKHKCFKDYGARGIAVCEEWKNSFNNFYDWAIKNGHQIGLWLERKDNNLGYSPRNCCWADIPTQARNRRSNKIIVWNGHALPVSVFERENDMPFGYVWAMQKRGLTIDEIINKSKTSRPYAK